MSLRAVADCFWFVNSAPEQIVCPCPFPSVCFPGSWRVAFTHTDAFLTAGAPRALRSLHASSLSSAVHTGTVSLGAGPSVTVVGPPRQSWLSSPSTADSLPSPVSVSLLAAAPWDPRRRRQGLLCAWLTPGAAFARRDCQPDDPVLVPLAGKQFKCTVCDYTAAQKPQLLRHMEQHASFKVRARGGERRSAWAPCPLLALASPSLSGPPSAHRERTGLSHADVASTERLLRATLCGGLDTPQLGSLMRS